MSIFDKALELPQLLRSKTGKFDLFAQETDQDSIEFRNNRLNSVHSKKASGLGLRVFLDDRVGMASTNSLSDDGTIGLSKQDLLERGIASARQGDKALFPLPSHTLKDERGVAIDMDAEGPKIIKKGEKFVEGMRARFPDMRFGFQCQRVFRRNLLLNSASSEIRTTKEYASISLSATRTEDGNIQEIWQSVSVPDALPYEEMERMEKEMVYLLEHSMRETKLGSGKKKVLFTPKAYQSLVSILIDAFKAQMIHRKTSWLADKQGQKIGAGMFSLMEDPTYKGGISTSVYDHEGTACSKKFLVREGVVESMIASLSSSEKTGLPALGNGFRSPFSLPHDDTTNLIVCPGTASFEDLLSGVKDGILVDQLLGAGQSNTYSGEFSVNLDLAFRIENGEVTGRLKNCMLADNVFRMLERMESAGRDLYSFGDLFLPYMLFSDVNFTSPGT